MGERKKILFEIFYVFYIIHLGIKGLSKEKSAHQKRIYPDKTTTVTRFFKQT